MLARMKAFLRTRQLGKKPSAETREKLSQIAKAHARDPAWRQRVSDGTKARMHDPEIRERHLAALDRVFTVAPNGNNFTGGMGQPLPDHIQDFAKILCPVGYLCDTVTVTFDKCGAHYTLDFANVEAKVDIEIDGSSHRSVKRKEKDRRRDDFLRRLGWKVIRIRL